MSGVPQEGMHSSPMGSFSKQSGSGSASGKRGIEFFEFATGTEYTETPFNKFFANYLNDERFVNRLTPAHRELLSYLILPEKLATTAFDPKWENDLFQERSVVPQLRTSKGNEYGSLFSLMAHHIGSSKQGRAALLNIAENVGLRRLSDANYHALIRGLPLKQVEEVFDRFLDVFTKGLVADPKRDIPFELFESLKPEQKERLYKGIIEVGLIERLFNTKNLVTGNAYIEAITEKNYKLADFLRGEAEQRGINVFQGAKNRYVMERLAVSREPRSLAVAQEIFDTFSTQDKEELDMYAFGTIETAIRADNVTFIEMFVQKLPPEMLAKEWQKWGTLSETLRARIGEPRATRALEIIDERLRLYKLHRWTFGILGSDGSDVLQPKVPLSLMETQKTAAQVERAYPEGVIDGLELHQAGFRSGFFLLDPQKKEEEYAQSSQLTPLFDPSNVSNELSLVCRVAVPYNGLEETEKEEAYRAQTVDTYKGATTIDDYIAQRYKLIELRIPVVTSAGGNLVLDNQKRHSYFVGDNEYDEKILGVNDASDSLYKVLAFANPDFCKDQTYNVHGALERVVEGPVLSDILKRVSLRPFSVAIAEFAALPDIETFAGGRNPAHEEIGVSDGFRFIIPSYEPGEYDTVADLARPQGSGQGTSNSRSHAGAAEAGIMVQYPPEA